MKPVRTGWHTLERDLWLTYLAAAATAVHVLEAMLPVPGPWFKPGLANSLTLLALCLFDWPAAVAVTLIRIIAGSLASGALFSPTFLLSLAGAVAALLALALARRLPGPPGPVGLSILAAMAHIVAQTVVAFWITVGYAATPDLLGTLLPWLLLGAWFTGLCNGLLTLLLLQHLKRLGVPDLGPEKGLHEQGYSVHADRPCQSRCA
jgi:heptaprenyl diphosphate synthase